MKDDDQLRDLVGESRDQLRGDALTRRVLSLYPSKHKLTGRLMSVAEKSVSVRWRWITGTKTGITVDVSAKNVLPTFLFGEFRDKLRDWSVKTRDQFREDTRLADWI